MADPEAWLRMYIGVLLNVNGNGRFECILGLHSMLGTVYLI